MHRERYLAIIFVALVGLSWVSNTRAQEPPDKCAHTEFPQQLTSSHIYRLTAIAGEVDYGAVTEQGEIQSGSGICVSLFNGKNKQLIADTPTDSVGQFKFADVRSGRYVLVVSTSDIHGIVIPVELVGNSAAKAIRRRELMLHMRSREDRKKSFVTLITEPELRAELLRMLGEDQAVRNELIALGADHVEKSLEARMAKIDAANTARLKAIVKRYGWPAPELVGATGTIAAFMVLQHSPDLTFQQAMVPLVRRSYESGNISAGNYALLVDRTLMRAGKPQIYGTAVERWNNKEPVLAPLMNEANVDKRRAKIGLSPLREYLEFLKRLYFPQH